MEKPHVHPEVPRLHRRREDSQFARPVPPHAVRLLADDPCAEVRRQLISSKALVRHADTDMLLRLAASDPAVAEVMAEYLHDFIGCDVDCLEGVLAAHPDPSGRLALARNRQSSRRTIIALLSRDPDPAASSAAHDQI